MSYTKEFTVDETAWTTVVTGQTTGFVQLKDAGPVLVHVGQSAPLVGSDEGVMLNDPGLTEMSVLVMEEGDSIFVKSRQSENNRVIAVAPGTAPV